LPFAVFKEKLDGSMKRLVKRSKIDGLWRSGFTILEVTVASAIGMVGMLAVSEIVQNFYKSQSQMKSSLDLAQFDTNVRVLLTKDVCKRTLGSGYSLPGTSDLNANTFVPTTPPGDPSNQDVILRSPETGTGQVFGVGSQVSPDYRISRIYLRKKEDMSSGAAVARHMYRTPTLAIPTVEVVRHGIVGMLVIELENIPSTLPNPLPSPVPSYAATGPSLVVKKYDINFYVESLDNDRDSVADSVVTYPWKIGGCSDPEGLAGSVLGWAGAPGPTASPTGVAPGCQQVNSPDSGWANCPAGFYVMSQLPIANSGVACPACMKGTVCCYTYQTMLNSVQCCPIRK
jgi:Tfp pilus assembly protein PilV